MFKVYLGEDTPTQALFFEGVLSQGGALDITIFGDGLELLLAVQESPPDLVVSDILLPSLDGMALAMLLKFHQTTRDIPIVLVSAMAEEHRTDLEHLKVDAFLPKPIDVPKFRDIVAQLLITP